MRKSPWERLEERDARRLAKWLSKLRLDMRVCVKLGIDHERDELMVPHSAYKVYVQQGKDGSWYCYGDTMFKSHLPRAHFADNKPLSYLATILVIPGREAINALHAHVRGMGEQLSFADV